MHVEAPRYINKTDIKNEMARALLLFVHSFGGHIIVEILLIIDLFLNPKNDCKSFDVVSENCPL